MSEIGITLDELLLELQKLNGKNPEGFTTKEMAKHLDRNVQWCRDHLQELIESGRARFAGRRQVKRMDGAVGWVPVYQFIGKD